MNEQSSFRRLTIYFGLFSTIAAGLIGLGQESWSLPLLVGICSIASILFTDIFGWFYLHRSLVYVGMILGACIAIYGFLSDVEANRLHSVGNLLVYVQLPLMFQKKSKRVFEQWGVFLLLELVVAALVNDSVLYGVIMLPVLAIGVAALMGLAQFASHLKHNESVSESTGLMARWLHWLGKEQLVTRRSSGVTLTAAQQPSVEVADAIPLRWRSGIIPIALSALLFSVSYFYMLPRLHSGAFERDGLGWGGAKVGFSDQISLQYIGNVLQNDSPAFRLSMKNESDGSNYRPNQPPYIRSTVVHRYIDGPDQGIWQPGDYRGSAYGRFAAFADIPHAADLDYEWTAERDRVLVEFIEKSPFGEVVSSIPPFARRDKVAFRSIRRDWRIVDPRESAVQDPPPKRRYSFLTYAFRSGQDSPILPDMSDVYSYKQPGTFTQYEGELTQFPPMLNVALPELDRVLSTSAEPLRTKLSKALFLEDYFANSMNFQYSLSLTGPVDRSLDPIADFFLNKKSGHCQFFASSLALLLRSMKIPTRLVIGFRPSEYNDVGGYFQVSQNHAHVWVEAYFTLEEIRASDFLERTNLAIPKCATKGVWLRLDPTPAVDGSNAGGTFRASRTQTLDAMQDLWTEMVMNMDKSKQGSIFTLFAESSEGSYSVAWLQLQSIYSRMQSSRFIGGLLSPDRWFSWRVALGFFVLGAMMVGVWKVAPWLFPGGMTRGQRRRSARIAVSKIDYYERAAKLLKKLGLKRKPFETPREFLKSASEQLSAIGFHWSYQDLSEPFYARRFGRTESEASEDHVRIQRAIESLEAAVRDDGWRKLHTA